MAGRIWESWPKSLEQAVIEALGSGKSLRDVAQIVGCSHTVIQDYKRDVFEPAAQNAAKLMAQRSSSGENHPDSDGNKEIIEATKAALAADPILAHVEQRQAERLEVMREARAEGDLKVWAAIDRNDISATELFARLTHRLDGPAAGHSTTTVILVPTSTPLPTPPARVIDTTPEP